jgi:hypothetical protein
MSPSVGIAVHSGADRAAGDWLAPQKVLRVPLIAGSAFPRFLDDLSDIFESDWRPLAAAVSGKAILNLNPVGKLQRTQIENAE